MKYNMHAIQTLEAVRRGRLLGRSVEVGDTICQAAWNVHPPEFRAACRTTLGARGLVAVEEDGKDVRVTTLPPA